MSLFEQWKDKLENQNVNGGDAFFNTYLTKETEVYKDILVNKEAKIKGKFSELAKKYNMEPLVFIGFLDGINTSLTNELEIDSIEEESEIELVIDFSKLYYNMIEAKATWLYNLSEWENIFDQDEIKEIKQQYHNDHIAISSKVGRNDPCPCGSGKKYKKCCGKNA